MDSSVKESGGLKFTKYFSYSDCLLLIQVLHKNFGVKTTIKSTGESSQYTIYIPKKSISELIKIVAPFIIPEMKYKLFP
jgi:hypothetical protein